MLLHHIECNNFLVNLYSFAFKFRKVVQQETWGEVAVSIPPSSAVDLRIQVKELLKSVYVCQSYCKNKSGTIFETQCIYIYIYIFSLTAAVFVNRIFDRFYLEFDFWQMLRCILPKLHTIVWNTCGYPYVKLYLIRWSFTHGIAKSLGGSLFSGHSV